MEDSEIFQSHGYRFEIHKIKTPDNFILSAWRVPGKITESMKDIAKKPPVILQHGCLDNSATWTINYFNNSLPYLLLEEGYDVWMTNNRGNFNSYEHTNPKDYSVFDYSSAYWNFTFDDMAKYDLPSNIDYILDYTNKDKVTYIGHSQGTMQFFAGNCLQNVARKIEAFVGLGPVMYVNHMESPIATLAVTLKLDMIFKFFGLNNILLWPKIVNVSLKDLVVRIRRTIWRLIQLICGVGAEINIDLDRMPVMGRREPGGSSLNNMIHWIQLMKTDKFQMMDYGADNMQVYGQPAPPEYNTEIMKDNLKDLDMLLIRGSTDSLVTETDFRKLLDHLKDKIGKSLKYEVVENYSHLDYIWAKDSMELINKPVIDFLKQRKESN
uniref:Lipase n=1 Tax=Euplotes harpa TaxID=151035 RepID=A0A7S3NBS5_9SPIT|mmetsp:Transcript_28871/g.32961  ORF Transcript_28871/g.32961 Transcript_28871/m.32961 type:complete len:381 (+) Transcript_28871:180-1322(+)|eukprot:CAMPEP_0168320742 /NCGR_PEP_ID=MMETSP0213-20121227/1859_1 /TAXON_ID=151035 /ORGANISM="Euplotes harpa, Strain FSP1.4" /LENGTH=380 /DNA_ID=CAMNT_0008322265 /DNA_START=171 /DNA_END=1313 /DNA_ORIENTATION=+